VELIVRSAVPYLGPKALAAAIVFTFFVKALPTLEPMACWVVSAAFGHGAHGEFPVASRDGPRRQGWTPTSTPSLEERLDDH
jgi:hypothetical protein